MRHQDDTPNGSNGYFPFPQELFQPKPKTFTPLEEELFKTLLTLYMGTEPADDSWTITIDSDDQSISWVCEYSIGGYNYCAEDEYCISLDLSVGSLPTQEAQYQRISDAGLLLHLYASEPHLSRLYMLVEHLFHHSRAIWAMNNGHYDDPNDQLRHVWADLEILFEDLYQTGKTIHLHFMDTKLSPF